MRLLRGSRADVALNSLSSDFISATFASLGEGGVFQEIGKRSVWTERRCASSTSCVTYGAIALDVDIALDPMLMRSLLSLVAARSDAGAATSLPLHSFDMERQAQRAFRMLQSGLNTGKVVVRITTRGPAQATGSHLVTGGTGGLGMLTGRWVVQNGASSVILASRSGLLAARGSPAWETASDMLEPRGAGVCVERTDVSDATQSRWLVTTYAPLEGVWHAAGVLWDAALARQDFATLHCAYAPKTHGAWLLHAATSVANLRVAVYFSSFAALLGSAAQVNSAAANACLDALAASQRGCGNTSVSVQWGPWTELGMAAHGSSDPCTSVVEWRPGLRRLGLAEGLAALEEALHPNSPSMLGVALVQWVKLMGDSMPAPAFLSDVIQCHPKASPTSPEATQSKGAQISLDGIMTIVQRTAAQLVEADAPLMSAGIDSLGAVELRNQLQSAVGNSMTLSSTVVFDHPTARQLLKLLMPEENESSMLTHHTLGSVSITQLRVSSGGHSALLPGASSTQVGSCLLSSSTDTVCEVPATRWRSDGLLSLLAAAVQSAVRHGGFMPGCELFDNASFSIAPAEAAAMDPQQRLVLEHGYAALHTNRISRASLDGSLSGVFLGVGACEYGQILAASPAGSSVYAATGSSHSVACGRLSYVLGLNGPCAAYDTGCSAALVASHAAVRMLQNEECALGLSLGVSIMLTPGLCASFAVVGMTSPRGRCHTWDSRADGYVRSEACAAISLGTETNVVASTGLVIVCGCAVQQDGRSASLTAPNGQAQQGLLRAALRDAGATPGSFVIAEAHGTGTALGDPIEAGSLIGAVLSRRQEGVPPVSVGGVKATIGHAESAAGMTGLLRVVLGLVRGRTLANAQLRALNSHIKGPLRGVRSVLSVNSSLATGVLPKHANGEQADGAISGVSSFGYSGVIAHTLAMSGSEFLAASEVLVASEAHCPLVLRRRRFVWAGLQCEQLPRKSQSSVDLCDEVPIVEIGTTERSSCTLPAGCALGQTLSSLPRAEQKQRAEAIVLQVVGEVAGSSAASADIEMPLVDAGVDSLASTELASRLQSLTGIQLSPTVVFEHPSARAIANFLLEEALGVDPSPQATVMTAPSAAVEAAVVLGEGLLLPGGITSAAAVATVGATGSDAVGTVVWSGWDTSHSPTQLAKSMRQQASYGAFIPSIELFDSRRFRITRGEAAIMDPGQRLLLEAI
jgi:3-oxoacyl-(acyl-carrier-protein) synthase/acyl carrier protein